MQNNPDLIQKAKRNVRRYKIWCTIFALFIFVVYWFVVFQGSIIAILAALPILLLTMLIVSPILFNKCILSILNKSLDADTYLATICQGNLDTHAALHQLYGEYFCGHYQNVVSICRLKLNDPKMAKRYKYHYLAYLANVYFDIGDDEKLQSVCEQYESELIREKPSKQASCRSRFQRMAFYDLYLKRNIDACLAWADTPTSSTLSQYQHKLCKARLALLQGNTADANEHYRVLAQEAAQLNYGKLAIKQLAEQKEEEIDASLQALTVSEETAEVALYPAKGRNVRKKIAICLVAFALVFSTHFVIKVIKILGTDLGNDGKMEAYRESIRVLVEEDYDNVSVIETFTLRNGEEIIDTMFICKTDKDIIVGCTYVYTDDPKQYYEKMTDISIASLAEDRSPLWYCTFPSTTSYNQINSYFYTVEADVPADYVHLSTFEISGQKVYYVITEVVPGVVTTLPTE